MSSGKMLRMLRIYNDYKTIELSVDLGISPSYLSEIENNRKDPTLKLLKRYSEIFGIKISTLLAFSEKMEDPSVASKAKRKITQVITSVLENIAHEAT